MNLADYKLRILAILLAVLGLGALFWVTQSKVPDLEKDISTYKRENEELTVTESELGNLYNNMEHYKEETRRINDETEAVLTQFPTFMYLEDKILYVDELLKTDLEEYDLAGFSYGESQHEMNVTYGTEEIMMELYSVALATKYEDLTYTQVKEILDYGANSPQRFVINHLEMTYNENSGYLSGEFSFTTYFIPGQKTPYEFPPEVVEALGTARRTDDLFGARLTPKTAE